MDRWILNGVLTGVSGAAVVSIFFLVFDVVAGRPFWTPGTLGSTFFLGEPLGASQTPAPALIAGYTLLHGAVFVAAGLMLSFLLLQRVTGSQRAPGPGLGLTLAAASFCGLEIFFLAFLGLNAPGLIADFGAGRIAAANLLAALGMAAVLLGLVRR